MGAPLFNLPVRTNAQGALWLAVVGLSALTGGTQGPGGRTGTVSLGSQDGIPSKNIVVPVAITNAGALVAGLVAIHLNGENFTRLYKTVSGSLVELTNADISATFQITFAAVLY